MYYGNIKFNDISNGEGIRTSLFVSGCRNRCEMCFNQETWDFKYGKPFSDRTVLQILESLKPSYVAGLSLLGGEPMEEENQEALYNLVSRVKKEFPDKTIWCYTGYTFDIDLCKGGKKFTPFTKLLLSKIDVLIDGKFINDLKDITLDFRGSSNQRIIDVQESILQKKIVIIRKFK